MMKNIGLLLLFLVLLGFNLAAEAPVSGSMSGETEKQVSGEAQAAEGPAAAESRLALQQTNQPAQTQVPVLSFQNVARPGGDLPGDPRIQLIRVAEGFREPVNVVSAKDGTGRLFVLERRGRIRIVERNGQIREEPFIDLTNNVLSAFLEQGLYDMAFHPDFRQNGFVFIHFAELLRNGDSMIVRYKVADNNSNRLNPDSAKVIMQIDQPYANHNGGELEFGPDGYLYIGSGDGGWEGDPLEAGQNLATLLGKILRIDVNTEDNQPYRIPPDNPFTQPPQLVQLFGISELTFSRIHTQARPEIWAYGLRNPWKFSFDPQTGDMYMTDVGQNVWEEINFQPAASRGGENYGWDFLMGTHCFPIEAEQCPQVGVPPVAEYSHELGSAVIGMGVYRGRNYPALNDLYFFGDWGSGRIWGLVRNEQGRWVMQELLDTRLQYTGAGQDEAGDIYITAAETSYRGGNAMAQDALWKLVAADRVPQGAQTAPRN